MQIPKTGSAFAPRCLPVTPACPARRLALGGSPPHPPLADTGPGTYAPACKWVAIGPGREYAHVPFERAWGEKNRTGKCGDNGVDWGKAMGAVADGAWRLVQHMFGNDTEDTGVIFMRRLRAQVARLRAQAKCAAAASDGPQCESVAAQEVLERSFFAQGGSAWPV